MSRRTGGDPRVSVVIPTWNEAATIEACLRDLESQGAFERIVADASSPDGTASLAMAMGARLVDSPRGRGVQQNRGAREARGEVLLFLHADCRLEPGAVAEVARYVANNPRSPGGCLRMRVDDDGPAFRLVEAAAHLRAGVLGVPYGDQALFVPRWAFDRAGGFPETLLMEDVLIALRLRKMGRLGLLRRRLFVSPRRWRRVGIARQSLRNWALTGLAAFGVPPDRLAAHYPAIR